jgi:hypothetical protein
MKSKNKEIKPGLMKAGVDNSNQRRYTFYKSEYHKSASIYGQKKVKR